MVFYIKSHSSAYELAGIRMQIRGYLLTGMMCVQWWYGVPLRATAKVYVCVCLRSLCLCVLPAVRAWHKHVCVIVPSVFPCAERLLALYNPPVPRRTHTHTHTGIRTHTYLHTEPAAVM